MKKLTIVCTLAAVLSLSAFLPTLAEESRTVTGEYLWDQRDIGGDLKAVFTPTGEGTFDVTFHFEWEGEQRVWTGTAEGSLDNGVLSGKVTAGQRPATFTFEGTSEDGKFSGTHARERENGEVQTGTLTLGP